MTHYLEINGKSFLKIWDKPEPDKLIWPSYRNGFFTNNAWESAFNYEHAKWLKSFNTVEIKQEFIEEIKDYIWEKEYKFNAKYNKIDFDDACKLGIPLPNEITERVEIRSWWEKDATRTPLLVKNAILRPFPVKEEKEKIPLYRHHVDFAMTSEIVLQDINMNICRKMAENEEKLILEVLTEVLGYKPTIEDYKDCTIGIKEGQPDQYSLSHKGKALGTVIRVFPSFMENINSYVAGARFIPFKEKTDENK